MKLRQTSASRCSSAPCEKRRHPRMLVWKRAMIRLRAETKETKEKKVLAFLSEIAEPASREPLVSSWCRTCHTRTRRSLYSFRLCQQLQGDDAVLARGQEGGWCRSEVGCKIKQDLKVSLALPPQIARNLQSLSLVLLHTSQADTYMPIAGNTYRLSFAHQTGCAAASCCQA